MGIRDELGSTIPIMKWGEVLREIVGEWNLIDTIEWVDDTMIPLLSDIERYGIGVDTEKFIDRWKDNQENIRTTEQGNVVYTEYNPYTITSRHQMNGGVNFSGTQIRKMVQENPLSRFDGSLFLQFDYDHYHVRLIGKLIKYKLFDTSVHQWLKKFNMVVRMMNPKEEHSVSYMVV